LVRVVVQDTLRNRQWLGLDVESGFSVGRDPGCSVTLENSRFVSRRHFFVERTEEGWAVTVDPGASPIVVDDVSVEPGARQELRPVSRIRLAEFVLTLLQDADESLSEEQVALEDMNSLQRELHSAVLGKLDLRREGESQLTASVESLDTINSFVDDLIHQDFHSRLIKASATRARLLTQVYEGRLTHMLTSNVSSPVEFERIETPGLNIALEEEADDFTGRLARRIGMAGTEDRAGDDLELIEAGLKEHVGSVIAETPDNIQFYMIARLLKKVVCDMVFGLGPLQDLLDTPAITEIMVVSPELVYVERAGRVVRSNRTFLGDEALMSVIERIVAPLGRRIDRSQPLVDARLSDGSRVNAIIPPLALKGPCLTIRRFPAKGITAEQLVEWGSMTPAAHAMLSAVIKARKNVVVAGGTGSGKTTLLNVLSSFISDSERLVTIEDSAELRLVQEHVVSLETRPPNVEGTGAFTIRDLVKNALRMRPDRIIVGECRGEEAFDMLQAMNTGHDGSMTTIHANSSHDVIARIETMCLMAVDIPISAIRRQVTQAVDMIVFIRRRPDGRRLVEQVTEITGMHPDTDEVEMRDIMAAVGGTGELRPTGYMPSFLPALVDRNFIDPEKWFTEASK
jgi:pilus assembly protein CpaF